MLLSTALECAIRTVRPRGDRPLYLVQFVTLRCNASRPACAVLANAPCEELSAAEIDEIARSARRLLLVSLAGGEPFLREDLTEIARSWARHARPVVLCIPTNGSLPERVAALADRLPREFPSTTFEIVVSVDAVGPRHDSMRGRPGLYEEAIRTIEALGRVGRRAPNLLWGAQITFGKENGEDSIEAARFLREELGVCHLMAVLEREGTARRAAGEIDIQGFKRLLAEIARGEKNSTRLDIRGRMYRSLRAMRDEEILRVAGGGGYRNPCLAGRLAAILCADGEVRPCEVQKRSMGNIRRTGLDIRRLWAGQAARDAVEGIAESRCFCRHECATTMNLLFRPAGAVELVRRVLFG